MTLDYSEYSEYPGPCSFSVLCSAQAITCMGLQDSMILGLKPCPALFYSGPRRMDNNEVVSEAWNLRGFFRDHELPADSPAC